ncbi:hypothetical protein [Microbacterium sp. bgisy189]|uniref:hypothetical protein n=1 Tax=Microbacterium sp. bgisy189 TaxID=3413798 RepID=UPI003EBB2701
MTTNRTVHAVWFQSVDPEEACIGGCQWHPDTAQIDRFIESERAWRNEVDFEYLRKTLTLPDAILPGLAVDQLTEAQRADVTDWVDSLTGEVAWDRRVVLLGSTHPGGERRRIDAELAAARG